MSLSKSTRSTFSWLLLAAAAALGSAGCQDDPGSSTASTTSSSSAGGGSATSTSGDATTTTTGGGGGEGGGSGECATPSDCATSSNECYVTTCDSGVCAADPVAAGTPAGPQAAGDCLLNQCDGAGNLVSLPDDTDVSDDDNPCTDDTCDMGTPVATPVAAGTDCGAGLLCDGTGQCLGCLVPEDCPGADDECKTRTCDLGACGLSYAATGAPLAAQTSGDCKEDQCDGAGAVMSVSDGLDLPVDNVECTSDVCTGSTPSNPPLSIGSACAQGVCDGMGACFACNVAADCTSGACNNHVCETCTDGMKNGAETAIDCGGGACPGCASGLACVNSGDCASGLCTANLCQAGSVSGTTPADGATGISVASAIDITFTVPMNVATLTTQTAAGACSGSIRVSTDDFATCIALSTATPMMNGGNTVATIVAAPGLSYGSTYKVRVTGAALDANNGGLTAAYTSPTGLTTAIAAPSCNGAGFVVVSQVYGAGGNAGASFKNDFIELHNRGASAVSVAGWSVQYASATGTTWSKTDIGAAGSIPAGGYLLVQGSGGANGAALVPDITGTLSMAATAGKVALVNNTTLLTGSCPVGGAIVDFVGYGATANCFEGTAATPVPSATLSATRLGSGCTDTGDNAADFVAQAALPNNLLTTPLVCSCGGNTSLNESNAASEADYCVIQFPTSLNATAGVATALIYGQIFENAITSVAGADPSIVAQVGYGPVTANPENEPGWLWTAASFNTQIGNNDEYQASLTVPAAGTYHYAVRFSFNGTDWTTCDLNGAGSNAGLTFETTQLPLLVVQ